VELYQVHFPSPKRCYKVTHSSFIDAIIPTLVIPQKCDRTPTPQFLVTSSLTPLLFFPACRVFRYAGMDVIALEGCEQNNINLMDLCSYGNYCNLTRDP
jgi:hypothetical protein